MEAIVAGNLCNTVRKWNLSLLSFQKSLILKVETLLVIHEEILLARNKSMTYVANPKSYCDTPFA